MTGRQDLKIKSQIFSYHVRFQMLTDFSFLLAFFFLHQRIQVITKIRKKIK